MKQIWKYLRAHLQEDFSLKRYGAIGAVLVGLVVFNYSTNFEDVVLGSQRGFTKFLSYFAFFAIPYYLSVTLSFTFSGESIRQKRTFMFKSLFGLAILSLDVSLPFMMNLLSVAHQDIYYWLYKVTVNLISLFTILVPLLLYYLLVEKNKSRFYGLAQSKFDSRPYVHILLIMVPLVIIATFLPGFLKQYPMYKPTTAHLYFGIPEQITALTYELAYGLDFITVELLFRGFMVIGMIELLGRKSVITMAVIYCLLHFSKPAGEAISSVVGGYILGVIAYETRSIWGGIIVHVGIAYMMEVVSFLAKLLKQ